MGLTAAATGKSPLELLDPTDEDSVINPANPRTFLTVTLPDGSRISPFQAIRPVARLFLKPAADALGAGYEAYEAREGLRVAAVAFLDAYAKSQASEGKRFMSNRLALPARLILDVAVQNQDYFGRPIVTEDSALGAARQIAAYAGARQLPAFLQPFVEQGPSMVPGTEPTRTQRTIDAALEWAFNLSPSRVPRLPAEVDATLRAEVIRHGGDPGPDPLGAYFDLKLPQDVRARFEADHPEVRRFLQDRTLARDETFNRPRG